MRVVYFPLGPGVVNTYVCITQGQGRVGISESFLTLNIYSTICKITFVYKLLPEVWITFLALGCEK